MDVLGQFIEQLKHEIANLKAMLEPLESGRMHTGTKRPGEPWTDTTQAWIDHLKKTVKMYEALVDMPGGVGGVARPPRGGFPAIELDAERVSFRGGDFRTERVLEARVWLRIVETEVATCSIGTLGPSFCPT